MSIAERARMLGTEGTEGARGGEVTRVRSGIGRGALLLSSRVV